MNKLILLSSCFLAVAADMILTWWAKNTNSSNWLVYVGMILLNISGLVWVYSMRKGIESATAITLYSLFTILGCSWLGYYVLNEALSLINMVGIILAIIAIVLVSQ